MDQVLTSTYSPDALSTLVSRRRTSSPRSNNQIIVNIVSLRRRASEQLGTRCGRPCCAEAVSARRAGRRAMKARGGARHQVGRHARFHQHGPHAALRGLASDLDAPVRRQPNHRDIARPAVGVQRRGQRESVHSRQGDVGDDNGGRTLDGNPERFGAVRYAGGIESRCTQELEVSRQRIRIVFDHHDVPGWHFCLALLC